MFLTVGGLGPSEREWNRVQSNMRTRFGWPAWKKEGNNDGHVLNGCWKGWKAEMTSAERTTDPGSEVKTINQSINQSTLFKTR